MVIDPGMFQGVALAALAAWTLACRNVVVQASGTGFLGWEGWNFLSAAAGVLSLVALAGVIGEWIARNRRIPDVNWNVDIVGDGTIPTTTGTYKKIRLANDGRVPARIVQLGVVNFNVVTGTQEIPFHWLVREFDSTIIPATLTPTATSFIDAWIVVTWVATDDVRYMHYQWLPVTRNGPLAETFQDQRLARRRLLTSARSALSLRLPGAKARQLKAVKTVGPRSALHSQIPVQKGSTSTIAYKTVISEFDAVNGKWQTPGEDASEKETTDSLYADLSQPES
jgi:hypothetical protein